MSDETAGPEPLSPAWQAALDEFTDVLDGTPEADAYLTVRAIRAAVDERIARFRDGRWENAAGQPIPTCPDGTMVGPPGKCGAEGTVFGRAVACSLPAGHDPDEGGHYDGAANFFWRAEDAVALVQVGGPHPEEHQPHRFRPGGMRNGPCLSCGEAPNDFMHEPPFAAPDAAVATPLGAEDWSGEYAENVTVAAPPGGEPSEAAVHGADVRLVAAAAWDWIHPEDFNRQDDEVRDRYFRAARDLLARLAALPPVGGEPVAPVWSTTPPDWPGWYWYRGLAGPERTLVFVEEGPEGDLWINDGSIAVDEVGPRVEWAQLNYPAHPAQPLRSSGESEGGTQEREGLAKWLDNEADTALAHNRFRGPLYENLRRAAALLRASPASPQEAAPAAGGEAESLGWLWRVREPKSPVPRYREWSRWQYSEVPLAGWVSPGFEREDVELFRSPPVARPEPEVVAALTGTPTPTGSFVTEGGSWPPPVAKPEACGERWSEGEREEAVVALRWYLGTVEHRHPTSRHVGLVRNFLARLERGAVPPEADTQPVGYRLMSKSGPINWTLYSSREAAEEHGQVAGFRDARGVAVFDHPEADRPTAPAAGVVAVPDGLRELREWALAQAGHPVQDAARCLAMLDVIARIDRLSASSGERYAGRITERDRKKLRDGDVLLDFIAEAGVEGWSSVYPVRVEIRVLPAPAESERAEMWKRTATEGVRRIEELEAYELRWKSLAVWAAQAMLRPGAEGDMGATVLEQMGAVERGNPGSLLPASVIRPAPSGDAPRNSPENPDDRGVRMGGGGGGYLLRVLRQQVEHGVFLHPDDVRELLAEIGRPSGDALRELRERVNGRLQAEAVSEDRACREQRDLSAARHGAWVQALSFVLAEADRLAGES